MRHVAFVFLDDWVSLYIDGELIDSGHSLNPATLVKHMSNLGTFSVHSVFVNIDWGSNRMYEFDAVAPTLREMRAQLTEAEKAELDKEQ